MGRGHGSSRGGGPGGGVALGATERGYTQTLAKAMLSKEVELKKNDFETTVAFDDDGNVTFTKVGGARRVSGISVSDVENRYVTHNHPTNASLSKSDVTSAIEGNMKEHRAAAPNFTYSMKRPAKGWPSLRKATSVYNDAENSITAWNQSYIRNYKGDKNVAHRRALAIKNHRINKLFASRLGIDYTKQSRT